MNHSIRRTLLVGSLVLSIRIAATAAEPPMRVLVEELGMNPGQVFGVLRVAVTGQKVSPPLFESMEIIGKERVLERVRRAIALLETL